MPQYRYPLGTPSVGGVDRLLIEKQEDIRRQLDPKFPPKGFPADPWIVPTSLFTKAQTTEIQNYANAAAIRSDAEDARVNFDIQSFREIELGKFQRQGTYRPLKPEERAVIEERRRVQATLDQMRQEYPGVVREVEWDDGTQALFDHFNRQEGERELEAARANSPFALDPEGARNPMALAGGGSPFSLDPSGRRNPLALANPRASEGYSTIRNVAEAMGAAFDGRGFIRELTTWTTAWASDPTLNPEEWAANKKAWEPEFDAMYADLPRPAQVFIDELAPGNIALTIGLGGLSTVLSASGSPIARAISAVTAPVTKNPWTMVAHEALVSTAARVGYEESDGAPLPIRLAVGAAAAAVTANPRAITAPTGRRIQTAWKGLTEPPVATSPAPSAGTVLGAQIAPRPPEVKTAASGLAPIPDVIDIEIPQGLHTYRSPVKYPATESAQTALDRAADLQMQRGVRDGQPHGLGVPGNAAHALVRAQDALEFSGNNRFINAINRATDDPIIRQSYWAEQAASSEYAARIYPSRVKFLSYLDQTFGSTRNLPDAFEYVGPQSRRLHGIGISGNNGGNQVAAADHPLTGTIYDYLMNRDFYATPQGFDDSSFRNVLRWYNNRNLRANEALRGYGAEIGDFGTTTEDFYFPTINRASQIASIADPDAQARAVSGRLRERQFDSIAQRFMLPLEEQGGVFDPELDFAVAFTAVDNAKAMAAGRNTFRLGLGGSLEPRAGWIEVPALSNQNQTIYLPEEQAKTVARYFDQGDSVKVFNWLNILKNTALNADASPLTIQGSLAWFASPYDTTAQLVGAAARGDTFRAFSPEYLAESVASDPKGWTDFAFWMGMAPNAGTPQEFRTGLLEAIPGIGSKIGDWNDSVMSVLMQWMKREFHDQAGMLVKEGWSQDQAFAAAADVVRMVVPMTDTRKLGITATGNILQRAAVTSVSFIRQPIQFMDDAMTGYLKLGAKIPDEMLGAIKRGGRRLDEVVPERQAMQAELDTAAARIDEIDALYRDLPRTPEAEAARSELRAERNVITNSIKVSQGELDTLLQEESALRLTGRAFAPGTREAWAALTPRERAAAQTFAKMTGGITGLTALSAMLTADSRGLTPQEALERALPGQPDFWKLFIGSEASINIGGPLRSLAQAIMPGENGIPFENFPRYVRSKITPPISMVGELIANEDYYGQEIRSGNFAQQVFDSLAYAVRQIAPVSVVTPFELASQGYSSTQIASQTAGQFLGQNIVPPSHYERLERVRRQSARDLLADPTQWEAQGMTQEQMNAARSARNLTELRAALGTRAANHLVEFGNPEAEDALTAYLGELRRRAEGGDRDAEALLVSFDAQQRLEGLAMTAVDANGVVDKEAYRNARGQVITEMVGRNSAFADVFEGFGTSSNEVDRLSSQWYELFDRASVRVEVDGEEVVVGVDYELFNQLEEQFFAGLGPEKAALVEANVAVAPRGANPLEVGLREVRGDLEASGFWDIDDDVWSTVRKGAISTVTQLMEAGQLGERLTTEASKELTAALLTAPTYSDFRQQVTETLTQQIANTGIAPETAVQIAKQKLGGLPDIRAIDDAISEKKVEWAVGNQEMAESAIQWGYLSASESNIAASQLDRLQQQAAQPEQGAQPAPTGGGKGINSEAFQPLEDDFKPKRSSSAELSRMATDFTEHGLSYAQLAEKYGLSSRGAAEQRLRRHFGESPAAVRERGLRESQ